jgi:alpha-L-arabinofuranosidase
MKRTELVLHTKLQIASLADTAIVCCENADILSGSDAKAENSLDDPEVVVANPFEAIDVQRGQATCTLPPLSFAAMTLDLK